MQIFALVTGVSLPLKSPHHSHPRLQGKHYKRKHKRIMKVIPQKK